MKKLIRDTGIILQNGLLLTLKNPLWLFFGLFQPVVYLVLYYPFLKGVTTAPGFSSANAIQFFAPGLLMMSAIFNAAWVGFMLLEWLESGMLERVRVTPVSRFALALGFVLRSAAQIVVQSMFLLIATLFFGFHSSVMGIIGVLVLLLLVGITIAAASFTLAVLLKDHDSMVVIINFFTMPLILLSGIMLPLAFAPRIIQILSLFDPFRYAVDASRALINGTFADPAVGYAFGIFTVLAVLSLWWFKRTMQEAVS